ncbi:MAG: hypothetical protein GF350_14915 [Chitinivibrionales bacterium]|nr:hypothetical protein [Chitinivibrionales bacterium]
MNMKKYILTIFLLLSPLPSLANNKNCDSLAKVVMEGLLKNTLTVEQYEKAKGICTKQALNGIAEAQYHLGGLNTVHIGNVYPNDAEMWKWINISAENGYAKAQSFLGRSFENEKNYLRKKDIGLAIKWHTLAAEQRDIASMVRLEEIYRTGLHGVKADVELADYWAMQIEK